MFKRERGYTPWVARKAPTFTRSLNTSYIKTSTAAGWAIPVFLLGVLASPYLVNSLSGKIPQFKVKELEPVIVETVTKPIPKVIAQPVPVIETPTVATPSEEYIVPAIPMAADIAPPSNKLKAEELLARDYGLSTYDSIIMVKSAKDSAAKTGLDPSLLLALAAKTTKFKTRLQNKYIGLMNVRPELHMVETQKLKADNLSVATTDGSMRLGAEVYLTYLNASNGDQNAAIARYIKTHNTGEMSSPNEILDLKDQFSNI